MSTLVNYRNKTTAILTDSDIDTTQPSIIYNAILVVDVATVDPDVEIFTEELITPTDYETSTPGFITITTVVKTTDSSILISANPAVTNPDIDVNTTVTETTDSDGRQVTTLVSVVTYNHELLNLYAETVFSDDSGQELQQPPYRYIIVKHKLVEGLLYGNPGGDYNMTCQEMYSLMNYTCVKMSEGLYQTMKTVWVGEEIIELDEDTAFYGTTFFGEIRPVAKIWEAKTSWYGEKIPTEITPEIAGRILTVMKIFAREIVETEFERRYLTMRSASQLEAESWQIQKHEAHEWLTYGDTPGHVTPFLDYLAAQRNIDKTALASKILDKSEEFNDKLSRLLVEMQTIVKQFESCSSVWDLNILYEDYLGIGMPLKQAAALGRTISDTDYNRKEEWRIKGNGYYF